MLKFVATIIVGIAIGAVSVAALTLPRLHRRYSMTVAYADLRELMGLREGAEAATSASIDCWGDSLTAGLTASPGHDFPSVLQSVFHRQAINRGVPGETSSQIKARMLTRDGRDGPQNAIIWAGRNDDLEQPVDTVRNIADMVGSLAPGSHYLVLGLLNRDTVRERSEGDQHGRIIALNQRLAAEYGTHYVPIREILIAQADVASVDDRVAIEADVVPASLRSDPLHIDDQGQAFVAVAVESAIRRGGW